MDDSDRIDRIGDGETNIERKNQKLKLLYLYKVLMEYTDDKHELTLSDILEHLEDYGIKAERKSIYTDMETLRKFGVKIECSQYEHNYHYRISSRILDREDLQVIANSIKSSDAVDKRSATRIFRKLQGLCSVYDKDIFEI